MKKDWIFDSPEEVKMYEETCEIVRQVIEDNPGITPTKIADIVLRKIDPDYGRTPITSLGAFLTFKQIATRMLRRGASRKGRRTKPEPLELNLGRVKHGDSQHKARTEIVR